MGSRVALGSPKHANCQLLDVRTGGKLCQVQGYDVPQGINMVWDIVRGVGMMMHY